MTTARDAAYGVMCSLVLEDGRRWGETAAQYQRTNALDILDIDDPVRQSWIELPRGGRKTTDLAGLLLAMLVTQAPPQSRLYVGASDQDQATEIIDAAEGLISRTPELVGQFTVTGLVISRDATGAELIALPANASAMGKRAWFIVLDEVANWPDSRKAVKFWNVITSGNRKISDCRTVVITNAGSPVHWSWKRREVARTSSRWRFCSVPGPLPWLTAEDQAALKENATSPAEYDRLHLNMWADADDLVATRDDVEACVVQGRHSLEPVAGVQYAIGVDLSQVRDWTAVVTLHVRREEARSVVVVDALRVWKPKRGLRVSLSDVRAYIAQQAITYNRAHVLMDSHQARLAEEDLQGAGIRAKAVDFTPAGNNSRALLLLGLLRNHRIELLDDPEFVDELASLRLKETSSPGIFKLDTESTGVGHFDRATALALAAEDLVNGGGGGQAFMGWLKQREESGELKVKRTDWRARSERARAELKGRSVRTGRPPVTRLSMPGTRVRDRPVAPS